MSGCATDSEGWLGVDELQAARSSFDGCVRTNLPRYENPALSAEVIAARMRDVCKDELARVRRSEMHGHPTDDWNREFQEKIVRYYAGVINDVRHPYQPPPAPSGAPG